MSHKSWGEIMFKLIGAEFFRVCILFLY